MPRTARPIAAAMFFLAFIVLGVFSFFNIPIEMPVYKEEFIELNINGSWPGMLPDIVKTQMTSPIEEKVLTVEEVRQITSSYRIGSSGIKLEFDPKKNMEFAQLAIRKIIAEQSRR